jgi:hypothetical protein
MMWPEYIHQYSNITRISIELPLSFEEQQEDPEQASVIYADDLDEGDKPGARVLVKATALGAGGHATIGSGAEGPDTPAPAALSMAEAAAAIPGRELVSRQDVRVEGFPAIRQILHYEGYTSHETYLVLENVLFSITAVAPEKRAEEYLPAFDHAAATARLILPGRDMASWSDETLRVSVVLPPGWEAPAHNSEPDQEMVRFFGPEQPDHDDYRPTFSITVGEPGGFGEEWFEELCRNSLETLRENYAGFHLRSTQRFSISSLVDVNAMWFNWEPEPGFLSVQLQALIPVDRYRMFLVNAATLLPLADAHLPYFERILRSLRVL